mgnify:CR=1 FL=1
MNDVKELLELDFKYLFIAFISILVGVKFLWTLLEWFFIEKLGIKTKKQLQRDEELEKLNTTAKLAKQTAENLSKLEKQHTKDEREFRENLNKHMLESEKDRKALHQEMKQYSENRIKDREQSLKIQKELIDAQAKISKSVQGLVDKVDEFKIDTNERFDSNEEKENKRVRAELKNSISGLYRHHHSTGEINDIELETLEDLIEEYEAAGGENSFVHSLVQKEMYAWKKVGRD